MWKVSFWVISYRWFSLTRLAWPSRVQSSPEQRLASDPARGTTMKTWGQILTAAACLAVTALGSAGAAARATGDTWIGVWGYVISPPAFGPPAAPAAFGPPAAPPAPVTPLGV